jgi:hypothetical protein
MAPRRDSERCSRLAGGHNLAPASRVRCEPPLALRFSLGLRPSLDTGLGRGKGLRRKRHLKCRFGGRPPSLVPRRATVRDIEFYAQVLGLADPWFVDDVDLSVA